MTYVVPFEIKEEEEEEEEKKKPESPLSRTQH